MPDLLLELFSEEIPARMQPRAADDLKRLVTNHLVENGITYADAKAFAGPRRLTLALVDLPAETRATREERRGPRADAPEKAIEGFLRSTGLSRDRLETRADKKGEVLFAVIERPGRPAAEVVAEAVEQAVRNFPWPKSMRWGTGSLRWVRPLRRILCLLHDDAGAEVVPLVIDGIEASDVTEGHRVHGRGPLRVAGFEDYATKLEDDRVVLDAEGRRARIMNAVRQEAFALGLEPVEDEGLEREVAGLVEWPVVLIGEIDEVFLGLPPEVLRTSMKEHQKFFSLGNPETGLIERFATVANVEAADGGAAILAGNRRVLAARLADAKFFWENDLRVVGGQGEAGLRLMAGPLATTVFHEKLGTQADRVARIEALAREIAPAVGADPDMAAQAARVVKADLASDMVGEFPELQGTMGGHYARAAGLPDAVADACEAHYRPLGPSDAVPSEPVAVAVALADKIDMLTGFWAIDEKPTGSKDPFALRRAALGTLRTTLENEFRFPLGWFLGLGFWEHLKFSSAEKKAYIAEINREQSGERFLAVGRWWAAAQDIGKKQNLWVRFVEAQKEYTSDREGAEKAQALVTDISERSKALSLDLLAFLADRLKVALRDQGVRHDVIQACFDLGGQDDLVLLVARVKALQAFLATEDGANLLSAYRRAANIVVAEEKKDATTYDAEPDPALAAEDAERALFGAIAALQPKVESALAAEDFTAAMAAMAELRAPVDAFFDTVTVNADDPDLRANRLRLLNGLRTLMNRVAVWDGIEG
ncbi:MAG: glycine--tRNA ligase subunit beta [Paracoccaceae bacterium]